MSEFILSAFADEIDPMLTKQIEVLQSHGIGYAELRGINGKNVSEYTPQSAKEIKKQLDDGGIKVSSIGSPVGKIKITDAFEPHFEQFKNILSLADVFETRFIRLFSFFIPKDTDPSLYRDEVLFRMEAFVVEAKARGLILLHENEKDIYGDVAARCLDLLKQLGGDSFKAVFDPANFVQCNEITYPNAFDMLKPYIEYMHIKDALFKDGSVVPAGLGDGGLKEILTDLWKSGYKGFLSLEPHLGAFKGLADLELDNQYMHLEDGGPKTFAVAVTALKKLLTEIK